MSADLALDPIPYGDRDQVIGMVAATTLAPGSLLTREAMTAQPLPPPGEQLVGVGVSAVQLPATPLRPGNDVLLVPVAGSGGTGTAGTAGVVLAGLAAAGHAYDVLAELPGVGHGHPVQPPSCASRHHSSDVTYSCSSPRRSVESRLTRFPYLRGDASMMARIVARHRPQTEPAPQASATCFDV